MAQTPIAVFPQYSGGNSSTFDISAAAVLKATPGTLYRVVVQSVPSAGNLTINDCATTGAAAIGNQIISIPFGSLTAGEVIYLAWPCKTGIVVSSVGTGGVFSAAFI